MGCSSSLEVSAEVRVDIEFEEVSTGLASPVAPEDPQGKGIAQLSDVSTALVSPAESEKAKKVRFDEVSLHHVHIKECAVERKVCLRDPMTSGTIEDFRTFVEAFPKALEMKVELKRCRDFGRPKSQAKSS